ncbi:MAG: low molecular weight protein tyrosine phosphatase family protein [Verrucomicrobiaceae bacterium]
MKHILFLCSRNRLRSPTAEEIFRNHPGVATDSAGLSKDADLPLSADQIEWADLILVMETIHRTRLTKKFGPLLKSKKIAILHIPDNYPFMDPALITLLQKKCAPFLTP